uniref:Putative reverse transcriptase domain-containing protein n=1 Tax=Tanacetum cinerariifolium TaxID=118510 RepID=A0A699I490_TANCI|nr:putative reverse transcriptase domain-containing protein [Tanacetum cinerariifolium]
MADLPPHYVAKDRDNEPIEADVLLLGEIDEPLEEEEEDLEEEEMEDEEMVNDEDNEGNEEDDAEVINPYEEADPHNRPPPTSDEESEFAPPLSHERPSCNSKVCALGPMCCDLKSVHKGVKRLSNQMHDRYRTQRKMAGKLRQDKLRMNGQEFDITSLDLAVRENRSENSKMMKMIEGLSREFTELKIQNRRDEELSRWEAWVRGRIPNNLRFQEEPSIYTASVPRADDPYVIVRDVAMVTQEDEDDDPNAPRDTQPFKPRGSPHDSQIMSPRRMTQANIKRLIVDVIAQDRATRASTGGASGSGGNNANQGGAPHVRECTYSSFIKCNPTTFKGVKGAVKLCHWFERIESVFSISECAERNKKFKEWRLNLRVKDSNIAAYTQRLNELVLLFPEAVSSKENKVEAYIRGLPKIIKGETTSSRPIVLNEAVGIDNTLMEQKLVTKSERIAESNKQKWENNNQGNNHNNNNNRGGNVKSQAYVIRDAEHNQGSNVVTDIKPVKLNTSYEVKLDDGKVVSTNSVLRCCTLNLLNHLFDIDLMPIELGTFDVIMGMDWLVERDAFIVCGKKELHVLYKNKMLVVKSDSSVSRLKVISCIKARKYIERGSQSFLAQVTEKEPTKKQLQDMPVIHNFPEAFLDDLPGLLPPRQVEFKIELIPSAAPITCAPYRLAPFELKELSNQLKGLSEKGFIRPSYSP